jgi:hypothetical protein
MAKVIPAIATFLHFSRKNHENIPSAKKLKLTKSAKE